MTRPSFALPYCLAVLLLLIPAVVNGQEAVLSGTVTDPAGQPLVGAQVGIAGTTRGAVTDVDGRYQVTGLTAGETVQVRAVYLGYRDELREVTLAAGEAVVDFTLVESPIELDEIVVTGTAGRTQKRAIGNAVSRIDADEVLEKVAVADLTELIHGRAAGVAVLPSSGSSGAGTALRLRGVGSITQENEPLLYIDGVRVDNDPDLATLDGFQTGGQAPSRINDIVPEDIEDIEILKGPAASTLYGTEASAGVIQIITKKGRAGETRWNARVTVGANSLGNNDFPDNFGVIAQEDLDAIPEDLRGTIQVARPLEDGALLITQNPFDEVTETGVYQSYGLSASGGRDDFTFYVSGELSEDEGALPANSADQIGARANFQWTPNPIFDLTVSTGYTNNEVRLPNNDNNIFGFFGNMFLGDPSRVRAGFPFGEPFTPVDAVSAIESRFTNDRFTGGLTMNLQPWSWLRNRAILGLDVNAEENTQFVPFGAVTNLNPRGERTNVRQNVVNVNFDYNGTATFDLTESVQSATSVGSQITNENIDTVTAFGEEFPAPGVSTVSAAGSTQGFEERIEDTTVGVYVQEQLGWRNRLFLTGAVRFDDNSAFGRDFDFETYPKVSASYVVSEEDWFALPLVTALKLRAAYGYAGRQPAAFSSFRQFDAVSIRGGIPTITPDQIGNADLAPERSHELEIGFDAGLWEDRLALELTYYDKVTEDALIDRVVTPSLGFPNTLVNQFTNIAELENKGWELAVNGLAVDTGVADYAFSLTFATNDNEVTSLGGEAPIPLGFGQRVEEGFPVAGYWGRVAVVDAEGNVALSDEEQFLGRATPDFFGSFGSTLTLWNNLALYALFDWKRGHVVENETRKFRILFGTSPELTDPEVAETLEARMAQEVSFADEPLVEDGDFVKLREVSATYTLPSAWATAMRAARASLTLSARNVSTWTDYTGVDPEVNTFGQLNLETSDFFTVPQARRITTTLNLTF